MNNPITSLKHSANKIEGYLTSFYNLAETNMRFSNC